MTEQPQFDEASHTYTVDGSPLVSVTQAIEGAGLSDWLHSIPLAALERAQRRGTLVHRAIELYARRELDFSEVPSWMLGYIEGYVEWRIATGFEPRLVEHRFYHPVYRYAGTLDHQGTYRDQPGEAVVDFKTPLVWGAEAHKSARLQLAAYCRKTKERTPLKRVVLHLPGDGGFHEKVLPTSEIDRDFRLFLACLAITNYKRSA